MKVSVYSCWSISLQCTFLRELVLYLVESELMPLIITLCCEHNAKLRTYARWADQMTMSSGGTSKEVSPSRLRALARYSFPTTILVRISTMLIAVGTFQNSNDTVVDLLTDISYFDIAHGSQRGCLRWLANDERNSCERAWWVQHETATRELGRITKELAIDQKNSYERAW